VKGTEGRGWDRWIHCFIISTVVTPYLNDNGRIDPVWCTMTRSRECVEVEFYCQANGSSQIYLYQLIRSIKYTEITEHQGLYRGANRCPCTKKAIRYFRMEKAV